jgi:hypothetical protein
MKKIPMFSKIALMLIAGFSASSAIAGDCCVPFLNFFNCGTWSYQIRGGVYPTLWRNRGDVFLNSCDCISGSSTVGDNLGELPKFNKFFKLPFFIGTQLAYAWSECSDLYFEMNFIQGSPKKTAQNTLSEINPALLVRLGHYRAISGYVGAHYNFWQWCDAATLFVGAKIGAIYHSDINAHQVIAPEAVCGCNEFKRTFYKHATRISGGANVGIDYCWCQGWSLVLTGEVVVSGGPKGVACVPLTNSEIVALAGGSNLSVEKIKTEISFPVTLGVKYNF